MASSSECDPVREWATRPVPTQQNAQGTNALTVDVEDYFQVEAFGDRIDRVSWETYPRRVEANTHRILDMLAQSGARATFFTVAWVAERHKDLIRRIVDGGHELASHGYDHRRVDELPRAELEADLTKSKCILEDVSGAPVNGYRAPSFSIQRKNLWALDAVRSAGYRYSSTIYPIRHISYGIPAAPRFAFYPFAGSDFMEIPPSSVRAWGRNWPCGGGGYFRLLPYWYSVRSLDWIANFERKPCNFYFHPWEIDPDQPRIAGLTLKTKIRHYTNIKRVAPRIEKLLRKFVWRRIDDVFPIAKQPPQ